MIEDQDYGATHVGPEDDISLPPAQEVPQVIADSFAASPADPAFLDRAALSIEEADVKRRADDALLSDLDAAKREHDDAQEMYRGAIASGDANLQTQAMERIGRAQTALSVAHLADADRTSNTKREMTPAQMLDIERAIDKQRDRVGYYEDLIEKANADPSFVPDGQSVADWQRNLVGEKKSLHALMRARAAGRQTRAVEDPWAIGEIARSAASSTFGTVPEILGGAVRQFGDDVGVPGIRDIGEGLSEFGRGVRQDVAAQSAPELLKARNATDIKNWFAAKAAEGIGTSVPIIAAALLGGPAAGVGAGMALGIGQMRNSLEEAFAEEGIDFDNAKAASYVYLYGTAIGALESVTEVVGVSALSGRARKTIERRLATAIAKGAAKGAVSESITEALQELTEIVGVSQATGKPIDWNEAWRRMFEAGAAGGAAGSAMGGAFAPGSRQADIKAGLAKASSLGFGGEPSGSTPRQEMQGVADGADADPMLDGPGVRSRAMMRREKAGQGTLDLGGMGDLFSQPTAAPKPAAKPALDPDLEAIKQTIQAASAQIDVEQEPQALPSQTMETETVSGSSPVVEESLTTAPLSADEITKVLGRGVQEHAMSSASVESPDPYYQFEEMARGLPDDVNDQFQVHGMIATSGPSIPRNFLALLQNGFDQQRPVNSGPPRGGVYGVDSTRSNAPFLIVSDRGKSLRETGVKNVVLNGPAEQLKPRLQSQFPSVNFMTVADARRFFQGDGRQAPTVKEDLTVPEPQAPAQQPSVDALNDILKQFGLTLTDEQKQALSQRVPSAPAPQSGQPTGQPVPAAPRQEPVAQDVPRPAGTGQETGQIERPKPISTDGFQIGEERSVITPDGSREFKVRTEIVDLADLKYASGDMQPRDRSRKESEIAARNRAAELDPERLIPARSTDMGAPTVAADGTIISGNGRVMSIAQAYREFPDRAAAYKRRLGADAAGMRQPVLIQRIVDPMARDDLVQIADLSNRSAIAGMSATERAMRDIRAAGPAIMGLYRGGSFTSAENRQFYQAFMRDVVTETERPNISRDGVLTKEGEDRLSAAVLAAAYGDPDLLARMLESTDDNIKSVTGAMRDAAGAFIRLKEKIARGEASPQFDITPSIAEAAKRIADLRDRNIPLSTFLAQQDIFNPLDPTVELLLRAFYNDALSRTLSRQKLTELLNRYAEEAANHVDGGLIPDQTSPADVVRIARDRTLADERTAAGQANLFDRPSPARRDNEGDGGTGQRSESVPSQPVARGEVDGLDRLRDAFDAVLRSKTPRKQWAESVGASQEQIDALVQEALSDGRLEKTRFGQIARTAKVREPAPTPAPVKPAREVAAAPSRGAERGPTIDRATEKRLDAVKSDVARQYAQELAEAPNAEAVPEIIERLKAEKKGTLPALKEIHKVLSGRNTNARLKPQAYDAIANAAMRRIERRPAPKVDAEPPKSDVTKAIEAVFEDSTQAVPAFDDLAQLLPEDINGEPDLEYFTEYARDQYGDDAWNDLSDDQKIETYQFFEALSRGEGDAYELGRPLRQDARELPEDGVPRDVPEDAGDGGVGAAPADDRDGGRGDVRRPARADDVVGEAPEGVRAESAGDAGDTGDGARDGQPQLDTRPATESLTDDQKQAVAEQVAADAERAAKARADRETQNYAITDADEIGKGGPKAKVRANIEAIKVLRTLQDERRKPTLEEKQKLVKYVGWGAFSQDVFADHKPEWKAERDALKDLLSPDEYAAARGSTINAHYTSPEVIRGMWDALKHMGFRGGRVLEPSAGIGHFIGLTPADIRQDTAWTAVELDIISGEITKALYGAADVRVAGFETQKWPDNHFDLVISNVPFAKDGPYDPTYKQKFALHDYFFVKALDKVRQGGIVAFVTSSGTLDKASNVARREMAKRGTFLGAVRLPGGNQGAFKANAGTDVTTDIVFFRKKMVNEPEINAEWMTREEVSTPEGPTEINGYFAKNPEMMLGKMRLIGSMYGKGEPVLIGPTEGLETKISNALTDAIPAGSLIERGVAATDMARRDVDTETDGIKEGAYYEKAGQIYRKVTGIGEPQRLGADALKKLRGFMGLRSIVNEMLGKQARGDTLGMNDLREALNKAYDAFVAAHGPINRTLVSKQTRKDGKEIVTRRQPTFKIFRDDPDAYKVAAIEIYDEKTDTAAKAAIFTQDIVGAYVRPDVTGPADALAVSLNETGGVDLPTIARHLNLTEAEAIASLGDQIFLDPNGETWRTRTDYLSGDVVEKLEQARSAAEIDPLRYQRNVEALEAAQPAPLTRADINVPFGAPWVAPDVYAQFLKEVLDVDRANLSYNPATAKWNFISGSIPYGSQEQWGTRKKTLKEIIEAALNSTTITVTETVGSGANRTTVRLPEAEAEARAKVDLIRDAFSGNPEAGVDSWVWGDMERAARLEQAYNQQYNRIVPQQYDGSHLTFPGLAKAISFPDGSTGTINLLPHRVNAIWRIIQNGNTLLNHAVGSGKTWTAIMASMEMKRLGLIQRPMFVCPNHMLNQFSTEFYQAYPNAKLLVATKDEMSKDRRREFAAKVASDTWDGIIITHSAFTRIGMKSEAYRDYYQAELDALVEAKERAAIEEGKNSPTVKDLEKAKKRLEARLQALTDEAGRDEGVTFEELGVDFLFVDEAHAFKGLHFVTRHNRVKGISNKNESKRATDLYIKMRHLERNRPGRSAVFMTGTPVSNTMAELYTMQRYLQGPLLERYGIENFDAWAGTFGQITVKSELSSDSRKFVDTTSFSKFVNVPELMTIVGQMMDTQTADKLNLPRPKLKGGKVEAVTAELSPSEEVQIQSLIDEMEASKGKKPGDGTPFISLFTRGIQLATDARLVDPSAPFNPSGKIAKAIANIHAIWEEGNADPAAPNKLQVAFLDMGVPGSRARGNVSAQAPADIEESIRADMEAEAKSASGDDDADVEINEDDVAAQAMLVGKFNLYADMKARLVEMGVPEEQIAFIHDANTDDKKAKLFEKAKSGEIRILFGSTGKMGVGTNVQRLLYAMHHIDAPWKPADVEQRDGRILRQGNKNAEVRILRYITKRSFDAYRWQLLDRKSGFIGQLFAGALGVRNAEDIDPPLPEAAELKAAATGNPLIMEHAELTREVRQLEVAERSHYRSQKSAAMRAAEIRAGLSKAADYAAKLAGDAARAEDLSGDKYRVTLDVSASPVVVTERKKAGEAIRAYLLAYGSRIWGSQPRTVELGNIGGFRMAADVVKTTDGLRILPAIIGDQTYFGKEPFLLSDTGNDSTLAQRWVNLMSGVPEYVESANARVAAYEKELPLLDRAAEEKPFLRKPELVRKAQRLARITQVLKADGKLSPSDLKARDEYVAQAMTNLKATSRTAAGVVDTSASPGKAGQMAEGLTGEAAAKAALTNFEEVIKDIYARREMLTLLKPQELGAEADRIAVAINTGILKEGALYREDDSPKYPYTLVADLPLAYRQFYEELSDRLNDPAADPVETAAFIEWRANLTDHFWADGVGKTSKALAALPLMRAGLPLPQYRSNKEFFQHASKRRFDPKDGPESYLGEDWQNFLGYYRSLMPSVGGELNTEQGPPKDKPVVMVFGGSFNPIHQGHVDSVTNAIRLVKQAGYRVDKAIVVPTANKLLKAKLGDKAYPLEEREKMAAIAFKDRPDISVNTAASFEAERFEGKIRRTQLADWAASAYPGRTVINVTGADAAPGNPPSFPSVYEGDKGSSHEGYYYLAMPRDEASESNISSSMIRNAVAEGRPLQDGWMAPELEAQWRDMLERMPHLRPEPKVPFDPVLDAPNFGLPEPPRTLADDDPLLVPHWDDDPAKQDTSPERIAMRERLIDQRFEGKIPAPMDRKPIAILMGGGGASGKGTVLKWLMKNGYADESFVELDPDSFKTGDRKHGWEGIPEYRRIVDAGDSRAASVTHEESSYTYKQAQARGMAGRYDLVLDQTMGNPAKGQKLLQQLKDAGYEVRMVGVTVDPDVAVARAVKRAQGPEKRYVPLDQLLTAHKGFTQGFETYAANADMAVLIDTNGPATSQNINISANKPQGGPLEVLDNDSYINFGRKGQIDEKASTLRRLLGSIGKKASEGLEQSGGRSQGDQPEGVGRNQEGARGGDDRQRSGRPDRLSGWRLDETGRETAPSDSRTEQAPPAEAASVFEEDVTPDEPPPQRQAESGIKFKTGETRHAKKNIPLFVASFEARVPSNVYSRVNAIAKKHGGYYSAYRGYGATPGFQFTTEAKRAAFLAEATAAITPDMMAASRGAIATTAKRVADAISASLAAGRALRIADDVVAAQLDAARPLAKALPPGRTIAAAQRIAPLPAGHPGRAKGLNVLLSVRTVRDQVVDIPFHSNWLFNMRAVYHRPTGMVVLLGQSRREITSDFGEKVATRVQHEIVHGLWDAIPVDVRRRLVDHANLLGVLDMQLGTLLRAVNDHDVARPDDARTLREVYSQQYAKEPDFADRMDQEAVAHLRELQMAGYFTDMELEAIADDLAYLDGDAVPVDQRRFDAELSGALAAIRPSERQRNVLAQHYGATRIEDIGPDDEHPGRVLAFHGTDRDLDGGRFDVSFSSDFGVHFGTAEQANEINAIVDETLPRRTFPVVLDLKNVVTLPDLWSWQALDVAREVERVEPRLSGLSSRIAQYADNFSDPVEASDDLLRQELTAAGIDGIRYRNATEGSGWSYIVWEPGRVLSATSGEVMMAVGGESSAIDAAIGQSMRRDLDALGYYFKALEAARGLKQAKGTPEQMLAQLKKAGVKDAEIEATKLRDVLDGKKSITRDEIIKHLEENRVGLTEVRRGKIEGPDLERLFGRMDEYLAQLDPRMTQAQRAEMVDRLRWNNSTDRASDPVLNAIIGMMPADVRADMEALQQETIDTKWSHHSLDPSNPTYQETVLHLPGRGDLNPEQTQAAKRWIRDKTGQDPDEEYGFTDPLDYIDAAHSMGMPFPSWMTSKAFQSGHFPEPNIIGHMMTSMVKHDGRPVFLVDQIQSDWGQRIRDGGIRDEKKIAELKARVEKGRADVNRLRPKDLNPNEIKRALSALQFYGGLDGLAKRAENPDAIEAQTVLASARKLPPEFVEIVEALTLAEAELRTAETSSPGNPLVNTTDQWVNTTLRRAIRQAVEAGADYIAIPTGATVESYNPQGDSEGNAVFYEKIVPKNLRNLIQKIDKATPAPQRIETLDSPSGKTGLGQGFTLFALTDAVKRSVMEEGQPMFAIGGGRVRSLLAGKAPASNEASLNNVIQKLKNTLDIVPTQTLMGATVRATDADGNAASVQMNPQSNVRGQAMSDNAQVGVRKSRDIDAIAHEGAHTLEYTIGAPILDLKETHEETLKESFAQPGFPFSPSEAFAEFFRSYITDPEATRGIAPDLVSDFEDVIDAHQPGMLAGLHDAQETYQRWLDRATPDEMASDLVSSYAGNSWRELRDKDATLRETISGRLATAYTATIDQLAPVQRMVRELLSVADRNGIVDAEGKPISLKVAENPYKISRMFAGSHATGYSWMTKGIANQGETTVAFAPLSRALELLMGSNKRSDFDPVKYQTAGKYLVSRRAIEEYTRLEQKQERLAQIDDLLTQGREAWRQTSLMERREQEILDRRQDALVRARALALDRSRAVERAQTVSDRLQQRLQDKKDDVLAAQMARDANLAARRQRELQILERDARAAARALDAISQEHDNLTMDVALLSAEIDQRRQKIGAAQERLGALDNAIGMLRRERDVTDKRGASRPPTRESKEWHEEFVRKVEADPKYENIRQFARLVADFQHGLLTRQYQAGFLSREQYDELSKRKDWYVPFQRDMSDASAENVFFKGASPRWSPFKKFDGSDRAIINPLETMAADAYAIASKIARNEATAALANLANRAGPGSASIAQTLTREEALEANAVTFDRIQRIAESMGIDSQDAMRIAHQIEENFANSDLSLIWSPTTQGPVNLPTIPFYRNGERVLLRLTDPQFGQEVFNAMSGLGKENMSLAMEFLSTPARLLNIGVTTHPTFMPRNLFRDIFDAWIKTGALPVLTQVRGVRAMRDKEFMRQYEEAGGVVGGRNVAALTSREQQVKVSDLGEGAGLLSTVLGGIAGGLLGTVAFGPLGTAVGAASGAAGMRVLKAKTGADLIKMTEAVETMTRIGVAAHAYKRAVAHNSRLSESEAMLEAAFVARDVFDWNRRGSKMLGMLRLVTFLNAQLQGLDAAARKLSGESDRGNVVRKHLGIVWRREHGEVLSADEERALSDAYRTWARMGIYTIGLLSLYALAASGDDEDDKKYQDIRDKTKATHSWLPNIFGVDVRLPKAFEWAMPANVVEAIADKVRGRDPNAWNRFVDATYEVMVPPVVPQALNLALGVSANIQIEQVAPWAKRLFGRDAENNNPRQIIGDQLAKLDPESQFDAFSSQLSIDLSRAIAAAGVPRDMVPSPKKIDFILRSGGYWGQDVAKGYNILREAAGGRPREAPRVSDIPIVAGFTGVAARQSKSRDELFQQMAQSGGRMTTAAATYKDLIDNQGTPERADQFLTRLDPDERIYALMKYHGRASDVREHPLERLRQADSVANGIRKDLILDRLAPIEKQGRKSRRNFDEKVTLSPRKQTEVHEIIERLMQAEAWNTMVLMRRPGWEGKSELAVKPILDELRASSPDVYEIYEGRLMKAKVVDFDAIKESWPEMRTRILRDGVDAF